MKKSVLPYFIIPAILLISIFLSGCQQPEPSNYVNYTYGFSCDYPDGWDADEKIPGTIVSFIGPHIKDMNSNVKIVITAEVDTEFSGLTAEEYVKRADTKLNENMDDYNKLDEYPYNDGNTSMQIIKFTFVANGILLVGTQAYISKDNAIYLIGYSIAPKHHTEYSEHYETVINSFHF